jgi:hypothetical protein
VPKAAPLDRGCWKWCGSRPKLFGAVRLVDLLRDPRLHRPRKPSRQAPTVAEPVIAVSDVEVRSASPSPTYTRHE